MTVRILKILRVRDLYRQIQTELITMSRDLDKCVWLGTFMDWVGRWCCVYVCVRVCVCKKVIFYSSTMWYIFQPSQPTSLPGQPQTGSQSIWQCLSVPWFTCLNVHISSIIWVGETIMKMKWSSSGWCPGPGKEESGEENRNRFYSSNNVDGYKREKQTAHKLNSSVWMFLTMSSH